MNSELSYHCELGIKTENWERNEYQKKPATAETSTTTGDGKYADFAKFNTTHGQLYD